MGGDPWRDLCNQIRDMTMFFEQFSVALPLPDPATISPKISHQMGIRVNPWTHIAIGMIKSEMMGILIGRHAQMPFPVKTGFITRLL